MAKGKNKLRKGKGTKKNEKHAFVKKEWYKIKSPPGINGSSQVGWTPINKTIGQKVSTNEIKGRIAEITYRDVKSDEDLKSLEKKIKIIVEEAQNGKVFTSFHGFELAKERIYSLFKKRQSVFESFVDVKTNDNQILRVFVIAITQRGDKQLKVNSYAHTSTIKVARKVIVDRLSKEAKDLSTIQLVNKVLDNSMNDNLLDKLKKVLPNLQLFVRKIKLLKKTKVDYKKLIEESNKKEVKRIVKKDVPEDEKNQINK